MLGAQAKLEKLEKECEEAKRETEGYDPIAFSLLVCTDRHYKAMEEELEKDIRKKLKDRNLTDGCARTLTDPHRHHPAQPQPRGLGPARAAPREEKTTEASAYSPWYRACTRGFAFRPLSPLSLPHLLPVTSFSPSRACDDSVRSHGCTQPPTPRPLPVHPFALRPRVSYVKEFGRIDGLELREKGLKLNDGDLTIVTSAWQAGFWSKPSNDESPSTPGPMEELGLDAPFYAPWAFKKVGGMWQIREETEVRSNLPRRGLAAPARVGSLSLSTARVPIASSSDNSLVRALALAIAHSHAHPSRPPPSLTPLPSTVPPLLDLPATNTCRPRPCAS